MVLATCITIFGSSKVCRGSALEMDILGHARRHTASARTAQAEVLDTSHSETLLRACNRCQGVQQKDIHPGQKPAAKLGEKKQGSLESN